MAAPTSSILTLCLLIFIQVSCSEGSLKRKNVGSLTETEVLNLQTFLRNLEDDQSETGFQQMVASYHGEPSSCDDGKGHKVACCVHGMATFPQWHRLFVVQFEQGLVRQGLSNIGVPYWDWTQPLTELPPLVQHQIFRDPNGGLGLRNAWFSGDIDIGDLHQHTARAVDPRLFEKVEPGQHTKLFDLILDALEQDDYCQFEVQFEVAHNHIHYLVGGRHKYSMSTLEYSSYDPIFFLHHSNVDRIFAIWQELQKKRNKPHDHADCSVELFRQPLHPFDRDSNPIAITKEFSHAKDLFSYLQLGYTYDDLTLNGMGIDQLYTYLENRHSRERAFAAFSLSGVGFSADVQVKVCEGNKEETFQLNSRANCAKAGDFFILGGANEMPWHFNLPFYFDISDAVQELHLDLAGRYYIEAQVYSVNGTLLGSDLLPQPYSSHRPVTGQTDPAFLYSRDANTLVRKSVDVLTDEEVYELRMAMAKFQNDSSIDGYQAIAEFHGLPARCPHPDAANRYACCIHGSATFPHWHRLFVVEVEDELKSRGLEIGIPYWDFTKPNAKVPALAADVTYTDPISGLERHNPFHDAPIAFLGEGVTTARAVKEDQLTVDPNFGENTPLFDGILLALEQTDFCDFEVQFEVVHNSPHFLVGGFTPYSLSSLHYSAFDPIFYLYHSAVDRIWAIWQQLQMKRGLPYKAHCANGLTQEVLKPFGFPPPFNNDEKTFNNARPTNIYDYERVLNYAYDTLQFGGMTVDQLEHYLEERQTRDRTFVGIELHNIGTSAWVTVNINAPGGAQEQVGSLAVLGGEKEMDWRFDRLYKMEITQTLSNLGLNYDDDFEVHLSIKDVDNNEIDENVFSHTTIFHDPAQVHVHEDSYDEYHIRSDITSLSEVQVQSLRDAMEALQADTSSSGFQNIAAFHGQPNWCPSPDAEKKYACCAHGMAVFPQWHRLHAVQAENALRANGFTDGLPYWDWTLPMDSLPDVVAEATYVHHSDQAPHANPLHHGYVNEQQTTRDIRKDELFEAPAFGHFTRIAEKVMLAFEQTDYCDFEVQFEIAHNHIHALVGNNQEYSMASLRYTAYDPIFYLHHSNTDRLFAIWQSLQKYRGKAYNTANCALASLRKPLQPFAQSSVINPDRATRDHAVPFDVFNYKQSFHYKYDNFQFNGLSIPQIQREVTRRATMDRVFAGFMLHGIQQSVLVVFEVCAQGTCTKAGEFYLLGDEYEIPWQYDRLFKYEITDTLNEMNLEPTDNYDIQYNVYSLSGDLIGNDQFGNSTIVYSHGQGSDAKEYMKELQVASSHVRRNLEDLTEGEKESLKRALLKMEEDGSYAAIASFHGYPGLCDLNGKPAACCVHGAATFPHWHRLYIEQIENALLSHGSAVSVPYWDWTQPIRELPDLINNPTYYNSRSGTKEPNPFFRWKVGDLDEYTTRDPRPDLFNSNYFLDNVMLALEQTSFCDFEIQFEIIHNAMHSFLGGRGKYSMSSLDYSAFDPVFILHHSNTDRIWAIWQALQKFRGLSYKTSDCSLNLMRKPLHPFDDKSYNDFDLTSEYARPVDIFDYSGHLNYHYDNLNFNSWTIPQLENALKQQRNRDRLFAGFLLHNIHTSADVEIYVCIDKGTDCDHLAGKFSLLGGEYEMPFTFDRLYKYDISETVRQLGFRLDSAADFNLDIRIRASNGSYINPHILSEPTIIFRPGDENHQDEEGHTSRNLVRKDAWSLTGFERRSLVTAMQSLQADDSADGFQALASFHALPPLCPEPEAPERWACCVHGMATFPQWHRLYTVQFEQALKRHGSVVGIPYFDSIEPVKKIPFFMTQPTWHDPVYDVDIPNPWSGAAIEFEGENIMVARDIDMASLSKEGEHGYDTWSFEQFLYALEQENYCDFEVQFEIAHNAIHAWLGGSEKYSMSHLHYASYDPAFLLHHANTDRVFAIWQELQKFRGHDPNEVNCALELMREPLKPFSFGSPYNLNEDTKEYSRPEDAFDYKNHFHYEFDKLEFNGMDSQRLQKFIDERKEHDRTFAGFLLQGFGASAHVEFSVCNEGGDCTPAGDFYVLGGSAEMPWRFDRLYKYEITDVLEKKGISVRDYFTFKVELTAMDGTALDPSIIPEPSVLFEPKSWDGSLHEVSENRVRHSLTDLTERDIMSLKAALRDLQMDKGTMGWQQLAAFHGAPAMCPTPEAAEYACCVHGMPTFPHWHRLYTVELEDALVRHGSSQAIPYWDWTLPIEQLPELFTKDTYYDAWRDQVFVNPFSRGFIEEVNGYTVRDPQPELHKLSRDGTHSILFDEVLLALEQTDFCDFEVQYEVIHNAIHYLVGGRQKYALSSLEYSSYDPIFMVHHSFVDKIWVVWQELQRRRGLPYDRADCAVNFMQEVLHPFDWSQFNQDVRTRAHAIPNSVFDYEDLGYHYDNFVLGGLSLDGLEKEIHKRQSHSRVFAGFHLGAIGTSADVIFSVCTTDDHCTRAGGLFILGGPLEMPWTFDRLFKYDITDILSDVGISPEDVFNPQAPFTLSYVIHAVNGTILPPSTITAPTVIFEPAHSSVEGLAVQDMSSGVAVRKEINSLTVEELKSIKEALQAVEDGIGVMSYQDLAAYHGYPAMCKSGDKEVACCHHGMASFPQWHRLFTRQLEMLLGEQGSQVGIPYWDWTEAFTELPALVSDMVGNPFHCGRIDSKNRTTTRAPRPQLFNDPEQGERSFFERQILLAFAQRDYCNFEVQFEVTHNAIHSWIGGTSPYGMSTLEYSAYDPIFHLHHSNVDRQFAIWQALQKYRGLDYLTATCNIQELRQPLEPFNRPENPFKVIRDNARAIDAFNWNVFNYQYDNLNFHGMTIPELDAFLEKQREEDHILANFMLHGIGTSADVSFDLCDADNNCNFAGTFAILGGPLEMDWSFDRVFKYDVTNVFKQMRLRPDSVYHFDVHITAVNGTELDPNLIESPSVSFWSGRSKGPESREVIIEDPVPIGMREVVIRREISTLTLDQVSNLRNALYKLQNDHGPNGYEAIASFHGAPGLCPENAGENAIACCRHGMPAFPAWHRLLTVQFERALRTKGAVVGVPYWDWTRPTSALPSLLTDPFDGNPFKKYRISFANHYTERDVSDELFRHPSEGDLESLFHQTLETLEETNYCDFEVQYEMLHNAVHELVGGKKTYGMSTLEYSAFDPFFMIHHSSIDRIWTLWQVLQKMRQKPFHNAKCADKSLYKPLEPFAYESVNTDLLTRSNSAPNQVFDKEKFQYWFDNLQLNGHSVKELSQMIKDMRASPRYFAGFILHGIQTSANVHVDVVAKDGSRINAGNFHVLGGEDEMPWAYERPYKLDITDAVKAANITTGATIELETTVTRYDGKVMDVDFPEPVIIERPANSDYDVLRMQLSLTSLPPFKVRAKRGSRVKLHLKGASDAQVAGLTGRDLGSYTNFQMCVMPPGTSNTYNYETEYALEPGTYYLSSSVTERCQQGRRFILQIDED